jgi:hypothetical protein
MAGYRVIPRVLFYLIVVRNSHESIRCYVQVLLVCVMGKQPTYPKTLSGTSPWTVNFPLYDSANHLQTYHSLRCGPNTGALEDSSTMRITVM